MGLDLILVPGHFGLPDDAHLYGCPQTVFKLHPAFDAVLAGVLRRDPRGLLVLLAPQEPHWRTLLEARFRAVLLGYRERRGAAWRHNHEHFLQPESGNYGAARDVHGHGVAGGGYGNRAILFE